VTCGAGGGEEEEGHLDTLDENLGETLLKALDAQEGLVLLAEVRVCVEVRALLVPRVAGVRVRCEACEACEGAG